MKRFLFVLMMLILACADVSIASDERKKGERKEILENMLDIITRPAEEIIGQVVELERIVVSPDKIREPSLLSASSITVVGEDAISSSQVKFMKDILTNYAGISKTQAGAFGGMTTIRMRGSNPNHTLLIIDNMKVYDPSSADGAFNFAHLPLDNIEQIEITRGPQGTLYGSDAIGGIINVETKKADRPFMEAGIEAGSYWTLNEFVKFGSYEKGLHYSFAFSQFDTNGISHADSVTIPNIQETDPYSRRSLAGRVDYELNDALTLGATMRNVYARFEYDDTNPRNWAMRDNDELVGKSGLLTYSMYVEHKTFEFYDYSVRYSYLNNYRQYFDYPAGLSSWYEGTANRLDFQNNIHIFDYDVFTVGYDYATEISDSYYYDFANGEGDQPKVFARNSALYLQNKAHFKEIIGSTQGMRIDYHSQFGSNSTYKIDAFYLAPTGTRLRALYGTAFKAPSLFQLYAPANPAWLFLGGNVNLKPEKARSYELGIEQYAFGKVLKASITYFQIRFSDLVKYHTDPVTFQSTYRNVSKAKSLGMEYAVDVNLFDEKIKIEVNLADMETKDYSTDRELVRVPQKQFNINVNLKPIPSMSINAGISHTGIRFNVGTDKMKAYTKVDLVLEYSITKNIAVFSRFENLFNKHYQEVRGYATPGLSAYGGMKARF